MVGETRGTEAVQSRTGGVTTPVKAAGWVVLGLLCPVALVMAFQVVWRHVRFSPGLVDGWPGGAPGFGLSCALAVLAGCKGTVWCLRNGTSARARIPAAVPCAALGVLGALYGLAVVPPRWCHQSMSPHCTSLPGAATAGLFFLGTLIGAFFVHSAFSSVAGHVRAIRSGISTSRSTDGS